MKILLYLFMLCLPLETFAAQDPNQYLEKLDQFLGFADFEHAFQDHFVFYTESLSCVGNLKCDKARYRIEIKKTKADEVQFHFYAPSDTKPTISPSFKKSTWVACNGNLVRNQITLAEQMGQAVIVESLEPTLAKVTVNGALQTLPAYTIQLSVGNSQGTMNKERFTMVKDLPGFGQVAQKIIQKRFPIRGSDTTNLTAFDF